MLLNKELNWYNINAKEEDVAKAIKTLAWDVDIPKELADYATDEDERAFLEVNKLNHHIGLTVVFHVIDRETVDGHYETVPMTFYVLEDRLLTVSNQRNHYIIELLEEAIDQEEAQMSQKQFLFLALTIITKQYFKIVSQIARETDELNRQLRQQTSKKGLLAMSDLETGLVYLMSAANQNVFVLEQLKEHPHQRQLSDNEEEQLMDAIIEARQLANMTQLNRQILSQLSDTFNNVLNKNLNDNLTALNIISVNLAIVAAITGYFGMNIPLPLMHSRWAWVGVIVVSAVLWFIIAQVLKRFLQFRR
ncbi:MAG: magnesium transporter CorA family protein [Streptococcus hyointestinalis]|uniref:magnesium transporter CorA family protein n=1 Tax=Streptococcus hyointestinalis TaxID=1337 RepID=UPI0023F1B281|nr:magnesium transporter CorA family protein [Streptococcus hyointestinalis]MCI6872209.1 magnesium transporter CorA family protein [Streptococcus hyointestinalis]MDD7357110.1 magnesium transporter CorA family protein [Streptococcus hyointestinalis]MDY4553411.1 magnesium transporter CorA family protein [Streptococcus hyointestinalis]